MVFTHSALSDNDGKPGGRKNAVHKVSHKEDWIAFRLTGFKINPVNHKKEIYCSINPFLRRTMVPIKPRPASSMA
jgi:hypothetical protein